MTTTDAATSASDWTASAGARIVIDYPTPAEFTAAAIATRPEAMTPTPTPTKKAVKRLFLPFDILITLLVVSYELVVAAAITSPRAPTEVQSKI